MLRTARHKPDYFLLALVFILTVFGLVILASASSDLGQIRFNDSYYYLKHQVFNGLIPGIVGFVLAYIVPYKRYKKYAFPLLIANIFMLGLVFTNLGVTLGGATRWLELGKVMFQPSELLKITFILYLSAWIASSKTRKNGLSKGLVPFLGVSALIAFLLLLQPSTSMVVILLVAGGIIYFLSGLRYRDIIIIALLGAAVIGFVVVRTPYRLERIKSYLNPQSDVLGSGYQLNQSLITIGSGKLFGIGYGQSTTKINVLPEPLEDSIFAISAQELGFIGASGIILLFALLSFRLLSISKKCGDVFGRCILIGFASIISFQAIINIGAVSGLLPLTGIPLPFVSYGGTSLAVFLTMSGISLNISKHI